jgi:hypothetical protein
MVKKPCHNIGFAVEFRNPNLQRMEHNSQTLCRAEGRLRLQIFRSVLIVRCTYFCEKYLDNSQPFSCPVGQSDMILSLHKFKKVKLQLSNSPAKKKCVYEMSYGFCRTF